MFKIKQKKYGIKGYNTFADAVCIFKILQRHKHNKKNFPR